MTKRNQIRLVSTLAAVTMLAATGCQTHSHDERSDGRAMDDKLITQAVEEKLDQEPVYKLENVQINTFSGIVQLSGFVNTQQQKDRAAEITKRVEGVRQVVNGIALKPEELTPTSNSEEKHIYSQ